MEKNLLIEEFKNYRVIDKVSPVKVLGFGKEKDIQLLKIFETFLFC
jgi:hypothetical protein